MRKKKVSKRKDIKKIAKQRIRILFEQAEKVFKKDPKLADRYVAIARRIAMKARVRIPKELKRRFCKHCYAYLVPGVNCRVRLVGQKVVYYCFKCKKYMRFPYIKEKKERKKEKRK